MHEATFRKFVCLLVIGALLAPNLASAQAPPAAVQPPVRPPLAPPLPAAAAPDYRLGPGDLLEVQIAGRLEVTRQQVVVDLDGAINLPPIGAVPVQGLTLLEAHREIAARVRALFRYADVVVSVAAPRAVEVTVSGEVEQPGVVVTTATRRLHDVIRMAGGVTPRGSLRRVQVTRNGTTTEVDLLAFELAGDLAQNPPMAERTRVHVPPRAGAVTLAGAVRRPGEYELGPDGSLRALLALVGGLAQAAAPGEARLTRVGDDGRKETVTVDLRTALEPPADVRLRPGDALFVPSLAILQDVVEVRGAFNGTPGSSKTAVAGKPTIVQRFELAQGERVRDVVTKAGGAAAFADLRTAFVERAGPTGPRQRIPLDLHRLLVEKDETQNILLQNGDVLVLPVVEDKVYVVGEVRSPGAQDYRPNLTPREYVTLAGGTLARARLSATTVTFRNGRTYPMSEAPPLEPGAVVTVPEVTVRWWQDYAQIATVVAGLVAAYTGLYILFGGTLIRGRTEPKPIYD